MITYDEAMIRLWDLAGSRRPEVEKVPLEQALGRISSESCVSPDHVPPFDNSAMDGFALNSRSSLKASPDSPLSFPILGTVAAGDAPCSEGGVYEIMTGAPLPSGTDCVIRIEDAQIESNPELPLRTIRLTRPIPSGQDVRRSGTDYSIGSTVLNSGTWIRPESLMALAAVGVTEVPVYKKIRVVILSTGKELVPHTEKPIRPGMIRNSSSVYLEQTFNGSEFEIWNAGVVHDDREEFRRQVKEILGTRPDVVLTTGAVSKGKYDFIREELEALNGRIVFHGCTIRPGKPILVGTGVLGSPALFFGLPGNPVSTSVGVRFFVDPYLRALMSLGPESYPVTRLRGDPKRPEDLKCFYKSRIRIGEDGTIEADAELDQGSYVIRTLAQSNGWVLLEKGKPARISPIDWSWRGGFRL